MILTQLNAVAYWETALAEYRQLDTLVPRA